MRRRVMGQNKLDTVLEPNSNKVFILDSMMGRGKTTTMMNLVPLFMGQRFIYVVEYLSEADRVKTELEQKGIKVFSPEKKGKELKSKTIKGLLNKGVNIVTTHALLDKLDTVALDILKSNEYIIILDETHKILDKYPISEMDLKLLIENGLIEVKRDVGKSDTIGRIIWKDEKYKGKFNDFKNLAMLGNVYIYSKDVYIWTFPVELFKKANRCFILTYLFQGSLMKSYFDFFSVDYEMLHLKGDMELVEWTEELQKKDIERIAPLINIYEGNLNIDSKAITLSSSYFNRITEEETTLLRNNLVNYFINIVKGKSDENMWTTLMDFKGKLKGKGYTKGFVSLSMRSTNEYRHKKNLAYVYNRYLNPIEKQFFTSRGIEVNENLYAISELLQWIFRAQIRDDKPINVYIPSKRMRTLLKEFLGK